MQDDEFVDAKRKARPMMLVAPGGQKWPVQSISAVATHLGNMMRLRTGRKRPFLNWKGLQNLIEAESTTFTSGPLAGWSFHECESDEAQLREYLDWLGISVFDPNANDVATSLSDNTPTSLSDNTPTSLSDNTATSLSENTATNQSVKQSISLRRNGPTAGPELDQSSPTEIRENDAVAFLSDASGAVVDDDDDSEPVTIDSIFAPNSISSKPSHPQHSERLATLAFPQTPLPHSAPPLTPDSDDDEPDELDAFLAELEARD